MSADLNTWKRIETEEEFRRAFADKSFFGDGARFTIRADGTLIGDVGGSRLVGTWYWDDGFFCRNGTLDDEMLELDCELIEQSLDRMRYTRDRGNGSSTVVTISRSTN